MMQPFPDASSENAVAGRQSKLKAAINPYVFLVGSPRSGTTVLKRMVAAHPRITITRETHWIPRFWERRKGIDADGRVNSEIVDKLFGYHRFYQMKIKREKLADFVASRPGLTFAELVSELFDRFASRRGKPLAGDKTPEYVRKLPTLFALWPATRAVHLIRDGRDVCLSLRNWRLVGKAAGRFATWCDEPVMTAALWWKALVAKGCEDGQRLGPEKYLDIRYELLVADPERACRQIAEFLAIPYDEAMPRYYEGLTIGGPGLSANAAWLPPTPGLRKWREQMPSAELEQFEAVAGDLLTTLGYPCACAKIPGETSRRAAEVKQRFTAEILRLGWRLPSLW
jgi:hypothetical protein